MAKNINVILTLQDRFTKKMSAASYEALSFKRNLAAAQYVSEKFAGVMHGMETAAVTAATAATAGMVNFTKKSLDEFEKFERAYNDVAGIMRKNPMAESMREVAEEAKEAARQVKGIDYTQSMQARQYMALAGWNDKQVQAGYVPLLKAMRIANDEDPKIVADAITDSMSAFGVPSDKMANFLDVAAAVQSTTNTNMLQAMDSALKMGPVLKTIGVDYKEGLELAGILANTGLKDTEGGNAIKSIYSRLIKNTGEAAEGLEQAGFSVYDSSGKLKGVTDTFSGLAQAIDALPTEKERNEALAKIGGTRQVSALSEILNAYSRIDPDTGQTIHDYVNSATSNASGALEALYNAKNSGYSGAKDTLAADWNMLKVDAGEVFAPYAVQAVEWLDGKLPDIHEWMENRLPSAIEKVKGALEELIEYAKPYVKFIWDNKETLGKGLFGAYLGMGAFRLATGAVTAADTGARFLNGLRKQREARAMVPWNEALRAFREEKKAEKIGSAASYASGGVFELLGTDASPAVVTTKLAASSAGAGAKATASSALSKAGGIFTVAAVLFESYRHSERLRESVGKLGRSFLPMFEGAKKGFEKFEPVANRVKGAVDDTFEMIGNAAAPAVDMLSKGTGYFSEEAGKFFEKLPEWSNNFFDFMDGMLFGENWETGMDTIVQWWKDINEQADKYMNKKALFEQMEEATNKNAEAIQLLRDKWGGVNDKLDAFIDKLEYIFTGKWGEDYYDYRQLLKFGDVVKEKVPLDYRGMGEIAANGFFGGLLGQSISTNGAAEGAWSGIRGTKPSLNPFKAIADRLSGNALGTNYWRGGLTKINERGGEIVDLPSGSRVIPADKSKRMMNGRMINVTVNVENVYGADERYLNSIADHVAGRLAEVM